ncbi:MAG: toll/interleukin-1 receptor domain-containing protein [Helicobacteraceae bacterium]|jgi:hypothetical protein|nr:toll/interleukin-1 receptor domain-containing protein [Helicobacteraceae bacterium]
MASAFVSYAHENARIVASVVDRLAEAGYSVWYDREIRASSTWTDEIARAIDECEIFIVFLSIEAVASLFVQSEIEYAFRRQKKIIPVYLDPIENLPPGLALGLNKVQGVVGNGSASIAKKLYVCLEQNNIPKSSKASLKGFLASAFVFVAIVSALSFAAYRYENEIERFLQVGQKEGKPIGAIALAKTKYAPAEPIEIRLDKAAQKGAKEGFVCEIIEVGADKREPIERREGKSAGEKIVLRAPGIAGEFEARAYAKNGGTLLAVKRFAVAGSASYSYKIATDKTTYNASEKISIKLSGVKSDSIDKRVTIGVWRIWSSSSEPIETKIVDKKNQSVTFLAPKESGRYEIRIYNNAEILTSATLTAKAQINVRNLRR